MSDQEILERMRTWVAEDKGAAVGEVVIAHRDGRGFECKTTSITCLRCNGSLGGGNFEWNEEMQGWVSMHLGERCPPRRPRRRRRAWEDPERATVPYLRGVSDGE